MIILDTQHVSQLQRGGFPDAILLTTKLDSSGEQVRLTIITPYEQMRACLGMINASNRAADQLLHWALLHRLLDFYAVWRGHILPFDANAAVILQGFAPALIRRIGSRDAKIAAIALAHGRTLLSANLTHFQQVPGLRVEDWLRN